MGFIDIFFIGVGLSMDAFAVSICKGLKMKVIDLKQSFVIALFFGVFQAVMPMIGYALSVNFVDYINQYSHWIAFGLLLIIGINMIRESLGNDSEGDCGCPVIDFKELFMLAIATSIDALAVGVTFGTLGDKMELSVWESVFIIGMTTFLISLGGVFIGNAFGIKYKKKSEIAGGVILIVIGIKVVVEHFI
ncbi:MAG: manganese efflux pump MntP family protein [Eubacterium sp.]